MKRRYEKVLLVIAMIATLLFGCSASSAALTIDGSHARSVAAASLAAAATTADSGPSPSPTASRQGTDSLTLLVVLALAVGLILVIFWRLLLKALLVAAVALVAFILLSAGSQIVPHADGNKPSALGHAEGAFTDAPVDAGGGFAVAA